MPTTIDELLQELGTARTARKPHRCTCADAAFGDRPNPNYRPDCLGDIDPGSRYWEYMGEAAAFQTGEPYCVPCALAVWGSFE